MAAQANHSESERGDDEVGGFTSRQAGISSVERVLPPQVSDSIVGCRLSDFTDRAGVINIFPEEAEVLALTLLEVHAGFQTAGNGGWGRWLPGCRCVDLLRRNVSPVGSGRVIPG